MCTKDLISPCNIIIDNMEGFFKNVISIVLNESPLCQNALLPNKNQVSRSEVRNLFLCY